MAEGVGSYVFGDLMSLSDQAEAAAPKAAPRWALGPPAARVEGIDRALRGRQANSPEYKGEVASLDASGQTTLANLLQRIKAAPVSPWVLCLCSNLVAELSKNPGGEVAGARGASASR